ncbi:hypothetical protein [Spiroplasma endosymbiont of Agriotes lineatus]
MKQYSSLLFKSWVFLLLQDLKLSLIKELKIKISWITGKLTKLPFVNR